MICIIALVVFGILGIFSASKRQIAKEAWDCVTKRLTLRKCTTGLDKRLKAQLTGKLMKKHKKTAKFIHKYFEVFSWIFLLLMVWSIIQTGFSVYYFVEYGNCNGPGSNQFCLFDPLGDNVRTCGIDGDYAEDFTTPPLQGGVSFGDPDAAVTLIEFGCYGCPNTVKAQDAVKEMVSKYVNTGKVRFIYKWVPLKDHEGSEEGALAAACAANIDGAKFWNFHNGLFTAPKTEAGIKELASVTGYSAEEIWNCVENKTYWNQINVQIQQALDSGVYGTPTFFINDEVIVGPSPFRAFEKLIEGELK
jgi:protein-disulfide isomerase